MFLFTMSTPGQPPNLRSLQIIVGVMSMGMVLFSVIAVVLPPTRTAQPTAPAAGADILQIAAFVITPVLLISGFALRAAMKRRLHARTASGSITAESVSGIMPIYTVRTVISAAIFEGAGLFGAVVAFITGDPLTLIGTALALLAMLVIFPTHARLRSYVADVTGGLQVM